MKGFKNLLVSTLLTFSITLSSCVGNSVTTPSDNDIADTTLADTTAGITESNGSPIVEQDIYKYDSAEYSYDKWLENTYEYFNTVSITMDDENSYITDNSSTLAWGTSYLLDSMYRSYCATGDITFLEQFAIYIYRIYELMADNDGDGYLTWGTGHYSSNGEYEEFAVHIGMIVSVAGEFVWLIHGDPELSAMESPTGKTYGELAEYIIDRSVNHAIEAFDCDWNDEVGTYMSRPGSSVFDGAEERYALPHNQYLGLAMAMINFAKVSPEHTEEYMYRVERMLTNFKNCITFFPNIGVATWNYNDPLFDGDHETYRQEDFSHGMIDVRAAILGYENGLVFTLEEIEMLTNTYDTIMYRPSAEYDLLTDYVDGTGESIGRLRLWNFDMSVYSPNTVIRGMEYMIANSSYSDAAQALVYHHDTPTPEQFSLTLPANDAADISVSNTTFLWQRQAKANYYRLQIAKDAEFTDIIIDRDKIVNSAVIVNGLPENAELYVRVIAMNMNGDSTICESHKFTTAES